VQYDQARQLSALARAYFMCRRVITIIPFFLFSQSVDSQPLAREENRTRCAGPPDKQTAHASEPETRPAKRVGVPWLVCIAMERALACEQRADERARRL